MSLFLLCSILLSLVACVIAADPVAPEVFCLQFDNDVSGGTPILINITRALAPIGADHLYAEVQANYYNVANAAFFRVVPLFVVQFGISGLPSENAQWTTPIKDDPVKGSNTLATISYATAGPNTRTTQLFINLADNSYLDSMGFAPLGAVVSGMPTVLKIFNPTPGRSDGVDQAKYTSNGQAWIVQNYPGINSITAAKVTSGGCQI